MQIIKSDGPITLAEIIHETKKEKYLKKATQKRFKKPKTIHEDQIMKIKRLYTMKTGRNLFEQSANEEYLENKYYEKFYTVEMLNALYSVITIMLSITYNDLTYSSKDKNFLKTYSSMLYLITFFSCMLWCNIVFKWVLKIKISRDKGNIRKDKGIFSTYKWIYMIVEIILFFVHPNILTEESTYSTLNNIYGKEITRKVNSIFSIFVLGRFYYIYRYIVYIFNHMDPETNRICKTHFFKTNFMYSLKVMFKKSPFFIYFTIGLSALISFSHSIRVFERDLSSISGQDWNDFWNAYWCILITMMTVGYGDYTAKTNEGRIFAISACIFGVFLTSMMIISVTNYLTLSNIERTAFTIFKKTEENEAISEMAKSLILKFGEFKIKNKNKKFKSLKSLASHKEDEDVTYKKIKNIAEEFNRLTSNKMYNLNSSPLNSSMNSLNFLSKEYEDIKKKQEFMQSELDEIKKGIKELLIF